jgi:hypothetical protein
MIASNVRYRALTGRTSWRVQRFTGKLILTVEVRSEVLPANGLHWPSKNNTHNPLDAPVERIERLEWRDAVPSDMSNIESILIARKFREQLNSTGPEA